MWTLRGTCAIQAAAAVSHVSDSNTNVDTDTGTRGCRDAAIAHPDAGDGLLQLEWDIPEGSGITSCQILWGPDADSLAVLLNASHRDAKGFVERGDGAGDLLHLHGEVQELPMGSAGSTRTRWRSAPCVRRRPGRTPGTG